MTSDQPLIFQSVYSTFLNVPQFSEPLETTIDGVTVAIRYSREGELGFAAEDRSAICVATTVRHPNARVSAAFAELADNRLPKGSDIPSNHPAKVGPDRRIEGNWGVPISWLPEWLRQYIDDVTSCLHLASLRAVRIARWRLALETSHRPIQSAHGPRWSYDGKAWYPLPTGLFSSMVFGSGLNLFPPDTIRHIGRLIEDANVSEPLGHELFREAWSQRHSNPRSALVVGIAAAEARVKEFIAFLEPGALWLVENSPSPPLPKILRIYIPELLSRHGIRSQPLPPPKRPTMQQIEKGIDLRNKVAHGVHRDIRVQIVEDVLLTIRDIQWMLDVFSGQSWARDNVRPEVLALWDPPEGREPQPKRTPGTSDPKERPS